MRIGRFFIDSLINGAFVKRRVSGWLFHLE